MTKKQAQKVYKAADKILEAKGILHEIIEEDAGDLDKKEFVTIKIAIMQLETAKYSLPD